jgi:NAD(P)-dependent dehydrogenase (short-subunit alcohol dehydrogenase family)
MAVDAVVAAVVREFGRLDIVLESAGISHRLNFLMPMPRLGTASSRSP